ncbi:hypothetical protein [Actinoplanes sp. NPDC049316]|uniref:hypothetical protein n=1 Tax=Actinoplanes sp. NPDC049316 TaxID=3154727 RepID=UPI0034492A93
MAAPPLSDIRPHTASVATRYGKQERFRQIGQRMGQRSGVGFVAGVSGDDSFDQAWRSGIQERFRTILAGLCMKTDLLA